MSCCSAPKREPKRPETTREAARREFAAEMGELEQMQAKSKKEAANAQANAAKEEVKKTKKMQASLMKGASKVGAKVKGKGGGGGGDQNGTVAELGVARAQLGENIEQLHETENKTAEMAVNAASFADMAAKMQGQEKKKSRFGF